MILTSTNQIILFGIFFVVYNKFKVFRMLLLSVLSFYFEIKHFSSKIWPLPTVFMYLGLFFKFAILKFHKWIHFAGHFSIPSQMGFKKVYL